MRRRTRPPSLRERLTESHIGSSYYARMAGKEPPAPPDIAPKRAYTKRTEGSSEHKEQCAVVEWWNSACGTYQLPQFALFAVPNGAHLASGYIGAGKLKREGMRSGIPDLVLAVPSGHLHGMFIEMKYGTNKPSDEQNTVLKYLQYSGYSATVQWTAEGAINVIKEYLA